MNMTKIETKNNNREPRRYPEHHNSTNQRLNWIRASVLGANDGIVSIAGLIAGVAGASSSKSLILMAGVAGVVAGAISMAAGEYVSVSSQRDTERALIEQEREEHDFFPDQEREELAMIYETKGLTTTTARKVVDELGRDNAFVVHLETEHGIKQDDLTNPWHAAIASALAFLSGSTVPLLAVIIAPASLRVPIMFVAVVVALIATGAVSSHLGGANKKRAIIRVVVGGILAMVVTYAIGRLFGVSGI